MRSGTYSINWVASLRKKDSARSHLLSLHRLERHFQTPIGAQGNRMRQSQVKSASHGEGRNASITFASLCRSAESFIQENTARTYPTGISTVIEPSVPLSSVKKVVCRNRTSPRGIRRIAAVMPEKVKPRPGAT